MRVLSKTQRGRHGLVTFIVLFSPLLGGWSGNNIRSPVDCKKGWAKILDDYPALKQGDPGGAFDLLHIDPRRVKNLTVVSLTPALGDTVIRDFSQFPSLRTQFPNAKINVISPNSRVLSRKSIDSVFFPYSDFLKEEFFIQYLKDPSIFYRKIEEVLSRGLKPETVVLWNEYSFDKLLNHLENRLASRVYDNPDLLQKAGLSSHVATLVKKGEAAIREYLRGARSDFVTESWFADFLAKKKLHGVGLDAQPDLGSPRFHIVTTSNTGDFNSQAYLGYKILRQPQNMYHLSATWAQCYLGDDSYLGWDEKDFYDGKQEKAAKAFLKSSFTDPNKPYIVVNFNTAGDEKVADLARDYAERAKAILEHLRARHPGYNVFVTPPEAQFGAETVRSVNAVIQSFTGTDRSVAFLPSDPVLWPSFLKGARVVGTQGSGFGHMANIFNPNVFIMARDPEVSSPTISDEKNWGRPGQKVAYFLDGSSQGGYLRAVFEGLDEALAASVPVPCKGIMNRFGKFLKRGSLLLGR